MGKVVSMKDNPEIWGDLLVSAWPKLAAAAVAVLIRYGMLIYDGEKRKNKWVEGLVCGVFAGCIAGTVALIPGLPPEAVAILAPSVGGFVGFVGVEKIRESAIRILDRKTGGNGESK